MKARRFVLAVLLSTLLVGGATATSGAAKRATKVEVTIKVTSSQLKGKVSSVKEKCTDGVDVILYYKGESGGFVPVADDETNSRGKYVIDGPGGSVPVGKYYSVVEGSQGCKSAQSKTVEVPRR